MPFAVAALLAGAIAPQVAAVDVEHYRVRLRPDITAGSVRGEERVTLRLVDAGDAVSLQVGELRIEHVRWGKRTLATERVGKTLTIRLPEPTRAGTRRVLDIEYAGVASYGLQLHAERGQAYTIFSTSQWMPANDAPSDRATLDLQVTLPRTLEAIGTGDPSPVRNQGRQAVHRWRLREPMPSYLYGFAAGPFTRLQFQSDGIGYDMLGDGFDASQLARIATDVPAMLAFFAGKAGVAYPHRSYAQALVVDTIGQELAGMAVLPEAYGRELLDDAARQGLLAHEAAHQWWGNGVTCIDWRQFWLNEGITSFMAAAWLQHRFGDAVYHAQVARWQARVDKLRADGKDRPLVFPDWNTPSADDRVVVYTKGAYAMHVLRTQLGDDAFWRGLRDYTRTHMGGGATTADFRRAMERASGRDLSAFFSEWTGADAG